MSSAGVAPPWGQWGQTAPTEIWPWGQNYVFAPTEKMDRKQKKNRKKQKIKNRSAFFTVKKKLKMVSYGSTIKLRRANGCVYFVKA